jgi:hypothetical protein
LPHPVLCARPKRLRYLGTKSGSRDLRGRKDFRERRAQRATLAHQDHKGRGALRASKDCLERRAILAQRDRKVRLAQRATLALRATRDRRDRKVRREIRESRA